MYVCKLVEAIQKKIEDNRLLLCIGWQKFKARQYETSRVLGEERRIGREEAAILWFYYAVYKLYDVKNN